jgi:Leucine-rich repeat (LRR) protein
MFAGAMLADACLSDAAPGSAASPADAAVADLSSRNISCIDLVWGTDSSSCADRLLAEPQVNLLGSQQLSLQSFAQLASLDLSDNRLECFAGLAVLPSLQQLNMSANRLKNLQRLLPSTVSTVWQCSSARSSSSSSHMRAADAELVACCSSDEQVQQEGARTSRDLGLETYAEQSGDPTSDRHSADGVQEAAAAAPASDDQEHSVAEQPEAKGDLQQQEQAVLQQAGQDMQGPGLLQDRQQQQGYGQQDSQEQPCLLPDNDPADTAVVEPPSRLFGFENLQLLDVSYNMLSGEQLLGAASPLGQLPRYVA